MRELHEESETQRTERERDVNCEVKEEQTSLLRFPLRQHWNAFVHLNASMRIYVYVDWGGEGVAIVDCLLAESDQNVWQMTSIGAIYKLANELNVELSSHSGDAMNAINVCVCAAINNNMDTHGQYY